MSTAKRRWLPLGTGAKHQSRHNDCDSHNPQCWSGNWGQGTSSPPSKTIRFGAMWQERLSQHLRNHTSQGQGHYLYFQSCLRIVATGALEESTVWTRRVANDKCGAIAARVEKATASFLASMVPSRTRHPVIFQEELQLSPPWGVPNCIYLQRLGGTTWLTESTGAFFEIMNILRLPWALRFGHCCMFNELNEGHGSCAQTVTETIASLTVLKHVVIYIYIYK